MRKSFIHFFLCFLVTGTTYAQGFRQNVVVESIDDVCMGEQSESADEGAEAIVDEIMGQMGLNRSFKIRKCANINNALAHIEADEKGKMTPYILYDPKWLSQMSRNSKTDWASIGVLAHEVGHFLLYHSLNNVGSNYRYEISADRFAGTTMARMGSTLEEAQSMFQNYPEKASSTHPGRSERMEAIKEGWLKVNNTSQKNILLNESTAEKDITPELIVARHFKSAGGLKQHSQIKELVFTEKVTERRGENLNANEIRYQLEYHLSPNSTIINKPLEGVDYKEEYLIKNDSLLWKYSDRKAWTNGAPNIGTTKKQDDHDFKRDHQASIQSYFDDFVLVSNPEVAIYGGRKRIAGQECFELELPEERIEIGDLKKKGKGMRVIIETNYYYNTATGLLHAIAERERIQYFKKGEVKNTVTRKLERIYKAYQTINDILLPANVTTTIVELKEDIPQNDTGIFQERELTEVRLVTNVSE